MIAFKEILSYDVDQGDSGGSRYGRTERSVALPLATLDWSWLRKDVCSDMGEANQAIVWIFNFDPSLCMTRNTLDCHQSNYSSRIVFSHIPIEFGQTEISAIRSADP